MATMPVDAKALKRASELWLMDGTMETPSTFFSRLARKRWSRGYRPDELPSLRLTRVSTSSW